MQKNKKALGRGLSALMADINTLSDSDGAGAENILNVPIELVIANPDQPRKTFSDENLQELAKSIKEKGIIQPLIVRKIEPDNKYEIVAGERRWRAAQQAQLHKIPVIVKEFSDLEVLEVAIIENIQRVDLDPLEEALGYKQLIERFGHTQDKLAAAMGKSRSHIANLMRLLNLPDEVKTMVHDGRLSSGHARTLVNHKNAIELANTIVSKQLSVRDAERLVKKPAVQIDKPKRPKYNKNADTAALENDLSAALGMAVNISYDAASGQGYVSIKYKDLNGLDNLIQLLGR
jgi:ParB family chromosome partitioning protein